MRYRGPSLLLRLKSRTRDSYDMRCAFLFAPDGSLAALEPGQAARPIGAARDGCLHFDGEPLWELEFSAPSYAA